MPHSPRTYFKQQYLSLAEISCPKLQIVQAGVAVRPAFCATGPVPASSYCHVRCPSGYNIQGNPPSRHERTLVCLLNETWSESIPTCQGRFLISY